MNPNDESRLVILRWFYDRNRNGTSRYGKHGTAVKTSDVQKGLKSSAGLKRQQVMSNLTYLVDKGWINRFVIEKTVKTKSGTVPSTTTWYEISAAGIDKIEGESEFEQNNRFAGINVHATGSNVITLGDGNIVNVRFEQLYSELTQLKEAVATGRLDDLQKFEIAVDIESIKDQLAKPEPDKTIVSHLWKRIETAATVGGFLELVNRITPLITSLLP